MLALESPSYFQPLPKAAVEKAGDVWGRAPFGVGPYKFVEWQTATRITLQRNTDFAWRPFWSKGGPFIDTIEFRIIPEVSTIQAGLEAGEIDFSSIQQKDVERTKATGKVNVYTIVQAGNPVYLTFNMASPMLSDLQVRKALAYAINRQPIIAAVYKGEAVEMYSPISAPVSGYDKVQETYGYKFDLAKAKSILAEVGWKAGADGILAKDGKPLKFNLSTLAGNDQFIQIAQIAQQQWKEIGVQAEIQQQEAATFVGNFYAGKFDCDTMGFGANEFDLMAVLYGSSAIGGANAFQLSKEASLDTLLGATRTTMDPAKRQEAVNATVKVMLENAYMINLAAPKLSLGLSTRVKGIIVSQVIGTAFFLDAYITK